MGCEVERNVQIWTSRTTFPALFSPYPPVMHSPFQSQWGALAPCRDPDPTSGADWAGKPQLCFPHSPLRGARGTTLLRCSWPGTLVCQEDNCHVEMLDCGTNTWDPDVAPVRAIHSGPSYSAHGLSSALTRSPQCRGLLLWQEGSRAGTKSSLSLWGYGQGQIPCIPQLSKVE